ncbi:MAG TPA: hypothetical protein VMU14_07365 [Acidimicrobiales bacterium]|nr:hypothetical protein [Acidimicrobiales bacterium]
MLDVGTFHGVTTPAAQTFATIQDAVNAAKKGDWILIAPGDSHEQADVANPPTPSDLAQGWYGGVDVETPGLHLRGWTATGVIVDGTLPNNDGPCSSNPADQNLLGGDGCNRIMVWEANGVSVDNLTACNFLAGSGDSGNEIWWNGGAGSGKIHLKNRPVVGGVLDPCWPGAQRQLVHGYRGSQAAVWSSTVVAHDPEQEAWARRSGPPLAPRPRGGAAPSLRNRAAVRSLQQPP